MQQDAAAAMGDLLVGWFEMRLTRFAGKGRK